MYKSRKVVVVIPALNEEAAIGLVVQGLQSLRTDDNIRQSVIDQIIVCDNGSSDRTADVALRCGAHVVYQSTPGYGIACLTAIAAIPEDCDIVLFVDGDHSCVTEQSLHLLEGICQGNDLAIGSRPMGHMESGALTPVQRWGNWLAGTLIQQIWKHPVSDLGPFRAIRYNVLHSLGMKDKTFGWTIEMQIRCIQKGYRTGEYPVDSIRRTGISKISGTVKGSIQAGIGILSMIAKLYLQERRLRSADKTPNIR